MNPYLIALLSVAVWLSGCVGARTRADQTRYYVLTPVVHEAEAAPLPQLRQPLHLGRVTLPAYLRGLRLVQREGEHGLRHLENHRWAEPLAEGLRRALLRHLEAQPGLQVLAGRDLPEASVPTLSVEVLAFDWLSTGHVHVVMRWRLQRAGEPDLEGRSERRVALDTPEAAGAVVALEKALAACVADLAGHLAP